jgi:hypothetical protein
MTHNFNIFMEIHTSSLKPLHHRDLETLKIRTLALLRRS